MTGILPSTSGVYHNPQPWRKSPVLKNAVTIPQHFTAHGYSAVGGGKIYHGGFPDPPILAGLLPFTTEKQARRPKHAKTKKQLAKWLPKTNAPDSPGNNTR
jgi:arylsulfatase A-like enzyme